MWVAQTGHLQADRPCLSILAAHYNGSWSFPAPKPSKDTMFSFRPLYPPPNALFRQSSHFCLWVTCILSAQLHLLKLFLSSGESHHIFLVLMCDVNRLLGELLGHIIAMKYLALFLLDHELFKHRECSFLILQHLEQCLVPGMCSENAGWWRRHLCFQSTAFIFLLHHLARCSR